MVALPIGTKITVKPKPVCFYRNILCIRSFSGSFSLVENKDSYKIKAGSYLEMSNSTKKCQVRKLNWAQPVLAFIWRPQRGAWRTGCRRYGMKASSSSMGLHWSNRSSRLPSPRETYRRVQSQQPLLATASPTTQKPPIPAMVSLQQHPHPARTRPQ